MANVGRGGGHSPANITKHLKGIDFPAQKEDLVKHAQHQKAEAVVLDEIKRMDDREYNSMADVMKAFGSERGGSDEGSSSKGSSSKGSSSSSSKGRSSSSSKK
ncbi:DUF2795 domain-containing protein [Geomonas sp. RF6]|uniref:DUF2795 domain-containing protein n=1 Tax=Geomonas sp. RF6 TaxID=2897342 RepID=UPI001E36BBF7|nr:DUF2795 domain-containing protein [Geomonas sp. RF6]UFS69179.1 DUF2795 domain-containing protein [Geomonas sp. RF6]